MKTAYLLNRANGQIAQLLDLARDYPATLYVIGVAALPTIDAIISTPDGGAVQAEVDVLIERDETEVTGVKVTGARVGGRELTPAELRAVLGDDAFREWEARIEDEAIEYVIGE